MKLFFLSSIFFVSSFAYSQIKIMTFSEAESKHLSVKQLDSLYPSPKKFFDGAADTYFKSQQAFLLSVNGQARKNSTKKDNGILWARFYVGKEGRFDYFLYSFEGKVSEESKTKVLDSLRVYLDNYRFPVKITAAYSFHQLINIGLIRQLPKGRNVISTLDDAIATTRPDTVKILALNQLELTEVPEIIYKFTEMKELNLGGNELKNANIDLTRLPKLKHLWLNANQLSNNSLTLTPNKTLRILNIQNNRFTDVPAAVQACKKLSSLWLGYNKLSQLNDQSFLGLRRLRDINLYSCDLNTLPQGINKLRRLEVIDLYHNNLKELPSSIGRMRRLQQLALSNNQLTHLPQNLRKLRRLQALYAHHNKLSSLPSSLKRLKRLTILDLNHNQFSVLPGSIGALSVVEEIDVSYNNLSELPTQMPQLKRLKKLYLRENPVTEDPMLLSRSKPIMENLTQNKTDVSY